MPSGQEISLARLCLFGAEIYRETNAPLAERLYRRAVRAASAEHGANSASVGLILLDFAEFLEKNGRGCELNALNDSIRKIFVQIDGQLAEAKRKQAQQSASVN